MEYVLELDDRSVEALAEHYKPQVDNPEYDSVLNAEVDPEIPNPQTKEEYVGAHIREMVMSITEGFEAKVAVTRSKKKTRREVEVG